MNPVSFRATQSYSPASASGPTFGGGLKRWISKDNDSSVYSDGDFSQATLDAAERRFQLIKLLSAGPKLLVRIVVGIFDLFNPKG